MADKKDTSWDKVADWYDRHVSTSSDYHRELIIPRAMEMLAPVRDEKILDVGCGQGVFAAELAAKGARVVGVDASKKLIDFAKKRSSRLNVQYFVMNASRLEGLQDGTFDAACWILALQNMEQLDKVISEASRVLKPGGRLLLVLNHPCFRIPRQSGWGFDEKRKLQYRRVDRYMSELKIPIQMHPGHAPGVVTWSFHRPLESYFAAFGLSGLAVTSLEEWVSQRKSQPGGKARAENSSRNEIPLFLALKAVKL